MPDMYNRLQVTFAIAFMVVLAAAVCGCTSPGHLVTSTVNPGNSGGNNAGYITPTPIPVPTPVPHSLQVSGDTIKITGYQTQTVTGFSLDQGVYVAQSSGDGKLLTANVVDSNNNAVNLLPVGITNSKKLVVVDGSSIYSGNATLDVTSDGDWSVTLTKQEAESASSLPQTMSGYVSGGLITAPFTASAGNIVISYTLSTTPGYDGYVNIYNIADGQSFYVFPLKKDAQEGQITAIVPENGVYIAEAVLAAGEQYGDITISQD
jgi:hypothetical protein